MASADARAKNIRLVCFDVDGTLTDGRLSFDENGGETKSFHVHDGQGLRLLGVFTDGDLRRALGNGPVDFNSTPVSALMAKHPKTVPAGHLAVEAAHLLEQHRINGLLVVDADGRCVGALNIHDLLQARVV